MRTLRPALEELDREGRTVRRLLVRVQRADGSIVEGVLDGVRDSALSVYVDESQAPLVIPIDAVQRVWAPVVVGRRYWLYLVVAGVVGLVTVVLSVQLPGRPILPGILLGVAVFLALLLVSWFPPLRNWIAVWTLRYPGERPGR
jgi:hypothetical protein